MLAALLTVWLASLAVTSTLLALVVAVQATHRALVTAARRPVVE